MQNEQQQLSQQAAVEPDWISVEDAEPETSIIAFTGGLVITLTYIDGIYYYGDGSKWGTPVTHWMPSPKPPKTK